MDTTKEADMASLAEDLSIAEWNLERDFRLFMDLKRIAFTSYPDLTLSDDPF